MDKRYGILIVSVTILVLGFVETASATTLSVDDDGSEVFISLVDLADESL